MGGGGGDNYAGKQEEIEKKKQQARDLLNLQFGYGPAPTLTDQAKYVSPVGQKLMQTGDTPLYDAGMENRELDKEMFSNVATGNRAGRDNLYQGVRDNSFTAGKRRLDEAQQDAARKLKFELFATGQAGGSGDIDQNALLRRKYSEGLIDLGGKADMAKADFRNADEGTRLQLLQSIDAGMDQGSALSSAMQQMQVASDKASASAMGTSVGDLFDNSAMLYNQSQLARGRAAGQTEWWNNYNPQGRKGGNGGAVTGVSTRLPGE